MKEITVYDAEGNHDFCFLEEKPGNCPMCHVHIVPLYRTAYYSAPNNLEDYIDIVWCCPNMSCGRLFISHYGKDEKYKSSEPTYPEKITLPTEVANLSERFCNIYNQSLASKAYNLTEVAGVGLRKALEVLIKDYCIFENNEEKETIKKMTLNACIEKYCDGFIKQCAHKTRVLGNDETHYERRYEDKDISDLENLINATILTPEIRVESD